VKEICKICLKKIKFYDEKVWGEKWPDCGLCSFSTDLDVVIEKLEQWLDRVFVL
jgi:hypothetical protein